MLSNFFKTKPVIDEDSKAWILDTFAWCITQLDGDFFKNNSQLILPNNSFFPGSANSVEEMANAIFTNTLKYTGLSAWPIRLVAAQSFTQKPMPLLTFSSRLRGDDAIIRANNTHSSVNYKVEGKEVLPAIDIAFHQSQLNQPQDLIAYLVQIQASILVAQHEANINTNSSSDAYSQNDNYLFPPGGKEVLPQTIDLVACFMGFGVIFSNTAYQFKGGCGSCNKQSLNRPAALPELETVYALALFCVLKGETVKPASMKQVKKTLKSHLQKPFRNAVKEITLYLQQTTNPTYLQLMAI
ncbi:hypothetical protein [Colwellia echini]|uniref:Orphan protein n=1 Tax=Colwellia echini TaxID=1982103 RepID=A0ABY3N1N3_9GAMM|nr:hypothetical protein [Colwellia echini]TYK67397.1 hypothetical protein CWS31_002410 [Colwellia echini]